MKKFIIIFAVGLLIQQITKAQGTTYVSNLGQSSIGSESVGSDSWVAVPFITGANVGGYTLNSVQLAMTAASGNPIGFTVMLYRSTFNGPPPPFALPGVSLGTLNGSLNPVTAGTYTYTPASSFTLSPNIEYFIVLTARTAVANGAYDLSAAGPIPYNSSDGWSSQVWDWTSSNGLFWIQPPSVYSQFAITATAIPEPSSSFLLLLGSGVFIYVRRAFRR